MFEANEIAIKQLLIINKSYSLNKIKLKGTGTLKY